MTVLPSRASPGTAPRPRSSSRVSPVLQGRRALGRHTDIPRGMPGWCPTAAPHHGPGTRALPRILLQQHNHPARPPPLKDTSPTSTPRSGSCSNGCLYSNGSICPTFGWALSRIANEDRFKQNKNKSSIFSGHFSCEIGRSAAAL